MTQEAQLQTKLYLEFNGITNMATSQFHNIDFSTVVFEQMLTWKSLQQHNV